MKEGTAFGTSNFDSSVSPREDFHAHATGGWAASHPIRKGGRIRTVISDLSRDNLQFLKELVEDIPNHDPKDGSIEQRVHALYTQLQDSGRRDRDGIEPMTGLLAEAGAVSNIDEAARVIVSHVDTGIPSLLNVSFRYDANGTDHTLTLSQGLLSLSLDYLEQGHDDHEDHADFRRYIGKVLTIAGYGDRAEAMTRDYMDVVTAHHATAVGSEYMEHLSGTETVLSFQDAVRRYPNIPLHALLQAKVGDELQANTVIIEQPSFIEGLDAFLVSCPADKLRNFLIASVVTSCAAFLGGDFADAMDELLFGPEKRNGSPAEPWKSALRYTSKLMTEELGILVGERTAMASSSVAVEIMAENIRQAYMDRLAKVEWLGEETRRASIDKIRRMKVRCGDMKTDFGREYFEMGAVGAPVEEGSPLLENVLRLARESNALLSNSLFLLPDGGIHATRTATFDIGATYTPMRNEVSVRGAMLVPPYFDACMDDTVNYGAIGYVIGHEMGHALDLNNRATGVDGVRWSEDEDREYAARASALARQFGGDDRTYADTTMNEDIVDLIGIQIAFDAMEESFRGTPDPMIDGLTREQRFFLSYALQYAANISDSALKEMRAMDFHAVPEMRVNTILRNMDAFHEAFGTREGDGMWLAPEDRVTVL